MPRALQESLKNGGFKLAFDSIRCKFKPTEQTLQICEESGTDLAQLVKKEARRRARRGVTEQKMVSAPLALTRPVPRWLR